MIKKIALISFLLAGCDGDSNRNPVRPESPNVWSIGPTINGKNYSLNCPRSFTDTFTIGPCEPHYITKNGGAPPSKLRYRLEGKVEGVKCPPANISLYFETRDTDWTKDGDRWWTGTLPLQEGEHELVVTRWSSVMGLKEADPRFATDKTNIGRVGFTFGDCTGKGHGVKGSARFTVLEFK